MIFRRHTQHNIDNAIALVSHAIRIVYGYKHNKRYVPDEQDIEKFENFEKKMWQHYCTSRYILMCMYQRANNRPELPLNWHDKEVRGEDGEE